MNNSYTLTDRKEFLFNMYNQLCSEIDRHINLVWQSLGIVLSTFAIFALVEKNIISIDIATSITLLVCSLGIAMIIEANFWYNRNLVIIANIEKQFLLEDDTKNIHWYFSSHRKNNAYLDMMILQIVFIVLLASITIWYHFYIKVFPSLSSKNSFDFIKLIPYLVLIVSGICLFYFHKKRVKNYLSFVSKSPGLNLQITPIQGDSDHVV